MTVQIILGGVAGAAHVITGENSKLGLIESVHHQLCMSLPSGEIKYVLIS